MSGFASPYLLSRIVVDGIGDKPLRNFTPSLALAPIGGRVSLVVLLNSGVAEAIWLLRHWQQCLEVATSSTCGTCRLTAHS